MCKIEGSPCGHEDVLAFYHYCQNCYSVWLSDYSDYNDDKKTVYNEEYVTKMFSPEGIRGYRKLIERYFYLLHFIASAMGKRNGKPFRFLEIGFSLPSVVSYFYKYGYDVTALDIMIPQKMREYLGPLADAGRFQLVETDFEYWNTSEKFDVLWMTHVLEHFEDTFKALKKINKLLKKTGVAFISSPDPENIKEMGVTGLMGHMHPNEHLFMYTLDTFSRLCARSGLKICFSERYKDPIPGQFEFVTKMEWRAIVVPQERHLA